MCYRYSGQIDRTAVDCGGRYGGACLREREPHVRQEAARVHPSLRGDGRTGKAAVNSSNDHELLRVPSRLTLLGGLMSYGPNVADLFRRTGDYMDKILRGANPGDIPVEQPTKFDLVINLTTAKVLGLDMPPTLFAHTDEAIE